MTNREYQIISEALEACKEKIIRSFDAYIEQIKNVYHDSNAEGIGGIHEDSPSSERE